MSSIDPDRHFVSSEPYDEAADIQALDRADLDAPTWLLIWRRFLRHKLGVASGVYLLVIYLSLPFIVVSLAGLVLTLRGRKSS